MLRRQIKKLQPTIHCSSESRADSPVNGSSPIKLYKEASEKRGLDQGYLRCSAEVKLRLRRRLHADISTQVSMKYRRNVGSLSIDMSADYRTNTLGRYVDRHIDRCIGRYIDRYISVDISAVCRSVCRPTYRSSIGRYVDRYIGRVSVDISTDTSVEGCTKYT